MTQWNFFMVDKKGRIKKGQFASRRECLRDIDRLLKIFGRIEIFLDDDKHVQIGIRGSKEDVFLGFPDPQAKTIFYFLQTLHDQISMRVEPK